MLGGGNPLRSSFPPPPVPPNLMDRTIGASTTLPAHTTLTETVASQSNMQKLLLDEKSRSERHKSNYEKLKKQMDQLSSDFKTQGYDLQAKNEEMVRMREQYNAVITGLESEIKRKNQVIGELEGQAMSVEKIEAIKFKIVADLQNTFKKRMQDMEHDVDKYRSDFNKLRHDHSFLKAEYEKQAYDFGKGFEELSFKFQSEKQEIIASKEQLIRVSQEERERSEEKVKSHVKENAYLKQRLISQQGINEEMQQQLEKIKNDTDLKERTHIKSLTDLEAKTKVLEMKESSLLNQLETLREEVKELDNKLKDRDFKVSELERENQRLSHENEALVHQISVKDGEIRLQVSKFANFETENCLNLKGQLEDALTEKEVMALQVDKFKQMMSNREKEFTRRLEKGKESHSIELNKVLEEKADLESKLITSESELKSANESVKSLKFDVNKFEAEISKIQEDLSKERLKTEELTDEISSRNVELSEKSSEIGTLSKSIDELQFKFQNLSSKFEDCQLRKESLEAQNEKLSSEVRSLETKLITVKHTEQSQYQATLQDWYAEKVKLNANIESLNRENELYQKKLNRAAKVHMSVKTKLRGKASQLKAMLEEAHSRIKFMEHKEDKIRGVPIEEHNQLKRDHKALRKKLDHFKDLMQARNSYEHETHVADLSKNEFLHKFMQSDWLQTDTFSTNHNIGLDHNSLFQWSELDQMKYRLDELWEDQKRTAEIVQGASLNAHLEQEVDALLRENIPNIAPSDFDVAPGNLNPEALRGTTRETVSKQEKAVETEVSPIELEEQIEERDDQSINSRQSLTSSHEYEVTPLASDAEPQSL